MKRWCHIFRSLSFCTVLLYSPTACFPSWQPPASEVRLLLTRLFLVAVTWTWQTVVRLLPATLQAGKMSGEVKQWRLFQEVMFRRRLMGNSSGLWFPFRSCSRNFKCSLDAGHEPHTFEQGRKLLQSWWWTPLLLSVCILLKGKPGHSCFLSSPSNLPNFLVQLLLGVTCMLGWHVVCKAVRRS